MLGTLGISISDLDFDRTFVRVKDSSGRAVWRWVPVGMPRLTQDMLQCVFFLYGINPKTGKMSQRPGGTGFFICRYSRTLPGLWHIYAVSNAHVVNPYSCIRINTKSGSTRLLEHDIADWIFSQTDDLAVIDITDDLEFDPQSFYWRDKMSWINELDLLGYEEGAGRASVGDQTIMIGLFADHLGPGTLNLPVARFGNLAAFADKDVPVSLGPSDKYVRPAFLNDMRSRSGFSGSPVWAWYNPYGDVDTREIDKPNLPASMTQTMGLGGLSFLNRRASLCLIGIHRGQFREDVFVVKTQKPSKLKPGDTVDVASSMTVIVPAWEIKAMLEYETFEVQRQKRDDRQDRKDASALFQKFNRAQENIPFRD